MTVGRPTSLPPNGHLRWLPTLVEHGEGSALFESHATLHMLRGVQAQPVRRPPPVYKPQHACTARLPAPNVSPPNGSLAAAFASARHILLLSIQ